MFHGGRRRAGIGPDLLLPQIFPRSVPIARLTKHPSERNLTLHLRSLLPAEREPWGSTHRYAGGRSKKRGESLHGSPNAWLKGVTAIHPRRGHNRRWVKTFCSLQVPLPGIAFVKWRVPCFAPRECSLRVSRTSPCDQSFKDRENMFPVLFSTVKSQRLRILIMA